MSSYANLNFGRKPGTARLSNRMNSIITAIKSSIELLQPFPALVLIYSSIDILGSLQNTDGFASYVSFKNWVVNYLLPEGHFTCDEKDFYGARCGIVHTLRYDSLHGAQLKTIIYGFHGHDGDIRGITDLSRYSGVYIEDLFDSFTKAYSKYLNDLESSNDAIINSNLEKLPNYIDLIPLDTV